MNMSYLYNNKLKLRFLRTVMFFFEDDCKMCDNVPERALHLFYYNGRRIKMWVIMTLSLLQNPLI